MRLGCAGHLQEALRTQFLLPQTWLPFQVEECRFVPVRTWQWVFLLLKIYSKQNWFMIMPPDAHWQSKETQICLVGCSGW